MKIKIVSLGQIFNEGRWDIDYHLPPEGIRKYPDSLIERIDECASTVKEKRDPTKDPDKPFIYIDIASIDVETGIITNPQELIGSEAPSRARKVVHAYDIIISTCRPTRGAIAVVPEDFHNQICSTGFSVIRPNEGINPYYLHYAIRLQSTLEQFRKWSTGSSYPAILDEDVEKTLIPVVDGKIQDNISGYIMKAYFERSQQIEMANQEWGDSCSTIYNCLTNEEFETINPDYSDNIFKSDEILKRIEMIADRESGEIQHSG